MSTSQNDIDAIQSLASLTMPDKPMYIVSDDECLYFVIGDKAYSTSPLVKDGTDISDIITDVGDMTTVVLELN